MSRPRPTMSAAFLVALLAAGAGGAGCDSAGSPSAAANPSASASASRQQALAVAQEWVQCLRGKGFTRMPDPQLSSEGYISYPPERGFEWKSELAKYPKIIEACESIQERIPASAQRPRQQVSAEDLRKLAEYAKCFREHGFPDFPDPNAQGEFDLRGTSLSDGRPSAKRNAADEACRHIWSGAIKVIDNGGGKK
ncbi:hypothetical protein [Actinoplanes aureus]|uniref:Lipoprotein n=1 Tax=Actinoplanes aureus TaxID=2792083 RepID=A0A931CDC9_9ACTN|nr:hypothetical protein [Actinoplanes aureus]MBG0564078.1 hypothetical protein [Actinoplanes aureus]